MERVTFILHLSLMLLVATAGAIFALAEARTGIPAITIPVAIVSCFLVDHYRIWRLPNLVQNILGVVAFAVAGLELYLSDIEAPLLSGGHLLSYLTCAFLLQPKGKRQFWWLAALSLLQVAVASVLTYDSWFGLSLPVFLLLMIWTLSVFQLQQAAVAAAGVAGPKRDGAAENAEPWAGRSSATRTAQLDDQHRWVTPRFVLSTLTGTALSLGLAGAFFLLVPRVWINTGAILFDGGRPIGGAPSRTGYTSHIALGGMGEIQESARVALEARLFQSESQQVVPWSDWLELMHGEMRFRGGTQEVYDDGVWGRWEGAEGSHLRIADFPRIVSGAVRQEVTLFDRSSGGAADVVFSNGLAMRAQPIDSRREVLLEPYGWTLSTPTRQQRTRDITYALEVVPWDAWFPNGEGRLVPFGRPDGNGSRHYLNTTTHLDRSLRDALVTWVAHHPELSPPSNSPHEIARRWEDWFLNQQELTYSLNMALVDPRLDPLLDFLHNTRRGHCEYFASALALLLRTQEIPTRVVSGYKGGQVTDDGAVVVRDLHAHLWVEAYIHDAPADPVTGQVGPRWITLDPTPAAREVAVAAQQQESESTWGWLKHGWLELWSGSIRMNQSDQQSRIYGPLTGAFVDLYSELRSVYSEIRLRGDRSALTSPRNWFSWSGGVAAFVLLLGLSGLFLGVRTLYRRGRLLLFLTREGTEQAAFSIPFYARLETLLREHGLPRAPSQTPREFIAATESVLATRTSPQLLGFPATVAEHFYASRYGNAPLTTEQSAEVDRRLDELERELDADALRRGSGLQPKS